MTQKLRVYEITNTINGEGYTAGELVTLIRLAGCNLRCRWCDTPYARDPMQGKVMSLKRVLAEADAYKCRAVLITGGEPLLQEEPLLALINKLIRNGGRPVLETSGSVSIEHVPKECSVVMDIKCPSSGECDKNYLSNLIFLKPGDEVKIVVANRSDYEWATSFLDERGLFVSGRKICFSPVWGELDPKDLAQWIINDGLPVRLSVQMHKIIWGGSTRK